MDPLAASLLPVACALGALGAWISALPLSGKIEDLKLAGQPRTSRRTDVIASAFAPAPDGEAAALRGQLRRRLALALALFIAAGVSGLLLSFLIPD
jgi:hypothetical protein